MEIRYKYYSRYRRFGTYCNPERNTETSENKRGDAFEENVITENGIPVGVVIKKYDQNKPIMDSVECLMSQLRNERYDLNLSSDTFARVMNALDDVCKMLERGGK